MSPERGSDTAAIAVVGCLVVLAGLAAPAAGGASAAAGLAVQTDEPTLSLANASVDPGETTTTRLSLSAAPDGLAGFNVTVRVGDPQAAAVVNASVDDAFGIRRAEVVDDGRAVVLRGGDIEDEIAPGDANVTLATLELRGSDAATTTLEIDVTQVDDDEGRRVRPDTRPGTVQVGTRETGSDGTPSGTPADDHATPTTAEPTTAVPDAGTVTPADADREPTSDPGGGTDAPNETPADAGSGPGTPAGPEGSGPPLSWFVGGIVLGAAVVAAGALVLGRVR